MTSDKNDYSADELQAACEIYHQLRKENNDAGEYISSRNKGMPHAFNMHRKKSIELIVESEKAEFSELQIFQNTILKLKKKYDLK